jgi:5,10-methylenetetrahydrofolate reductase
MLTASNGWIRIAEVNPPELPDLSHRNLEGAWDHVLITDNVFGKIRVSPYAFAARITHDVPNVVPTVVVSTRDRNILAIESEVRGALGNGVQSFLVVVGDTHDRVEHMASHGVILAHLRDLQQTLPDFEVGAPVRFSRRHLESRTEGGAQFLVAGPIIDPEGVERGMEKLQRAATDPPVFLMAIPPFSARWIERVEGMGAETVSADLKQRAEEGGRDFGWEVCAEIERRARDVGFAGMILMGLRYDTVVKEAASAWEAASARF